MKTLIINGSPRKNGDTVCLIKELQNHLHGDVYIINTYMTILNLVLIVGIAGHTINV